MQNYPKVWNICQLLNSYSRSDLKLVQILSEYRNFTKSGHSVAAPYLGTKLQPYLTPHKFFLNLYSLVVA